MADSHIINHSSLADVGCGALPPFGSYKWILQVYRSNLDTVVVWDMVRGHVLCECLFTETVCCSCTGDLHGVPTRRQHLSPFPSRLCLSAERSKLLSSLWRRGQQGQGGHHCQGWHHLHRAPCSCTWASHAWSPRGPSRHNHWQVKMQLWNCFVCFSQNAELELCSHLFSSSSCLTVGAEVSGRADSSLSVRSAHGFDTSAVPGSSRAAPLQAGMATTALSTLTPGPRETLESILVALDTEK